MSDAFNPVEEPDSFDGMYACDSMDVEQPLPGRRAEMQGSCESLAASSPSHSMELRLLPPQQTRPAAFPQGPGMGQQGRGGGFADPNDVEVNLEGQGGGWGEADDILTYVQSKARQDTLRCSLPFLERGVHSDSLAAAMTDLQDPSGGARPKHQESLWEAELAKELALKRSQQRNMANSGM